MIPNIEASYQRIANAIVNALPDGWQSATATAIFYSESSTYESEFLTMDGKLRSFDVSMELTRAFEELREKFKDAGKPVWGEASFELDSSGKFKTKWGYDNCDENGDTIWNEEEWSRRAEERRIRLTQP